MHDDYFCADRKRGTMTRVETIKWLESLKKEIGKVENHTLWHYAETIDTAIGALSEDDCTGCKHQGQWENEYEMGYPSPCTGCRRRAKDNYEAICKQEG